MVQNSLRQAFNAYEANYQFATAPPPPIFHGPFQVTGRVTLYWDDEAEFVSDPGIWSAWDNNPNKLWGVNKNLSRYGSFPADARKITDGRGKSAVPQTYAPQFDRVNEFSGNHLGLTLTV